MKQTTKNRLFGSLCFAAFIALSVVLVVVGLTWDAEIEAGNLPFVCVFVGFSGCIGIPYIWGQFMEEERETE